MWKFAMIPSKILKFQIWRLLTYHFFNTSIVHLLICVAIFFHIGNDLENKVGHFGFVIHLFILSILIGACYTVGALLTISIDSFKTFNYPIFGTFSLSMAISAIDVYITDHRYKSVFGIIHVPTKLYPLVMLCLYHIALPEACYLSSFAGLLVGILYAITYFQPPPKKSDRMSNKPSPYVSSLYQDHELGADSANNLPFALFSLSWIESDQKSKRNDKL